LLKRPSNKGENRAAIAFAAVLVMWLLSKYQLAVP
jgi:hypothetical protein